VAPSSGRARSFAGMTQHAEIESERQPGHDLRMAVVGGAGWLAGIAAHGIGVGAIWIPAVLVVVAVAVARRGLLRISRVATACALVGAGVVASTLLRSEVVAHGPLRALAEEGAVAELSGTVVSDPVEVDGQWGRQVVVRLRVEDLTARGSS